MKYCGFEIGGDPKGDGLLVNQHMYEQEMLQPWNINTHLDFPHFKLVEYDDELFDPVEPEDIKTAESIACALL